MQGLIPLIKSISHENRLRILNLLKEKKLCVCEMKNIMDIRQSNVSRHLKKLKQSDLVRTEKRAQWVYYELNDDKFSSYSFLEQILEEELEQLKICQEDLKRLEIYRESGLDCSELSEANIL